jgi:hypothetical protein
MKMIDEQAVGERIQVTKSRSVFRIHFNGTAGAGEDSLDGGCCRIGERGMDDPDYWA